MTPQMNSDRSLMGSATPSQTPLRDQLSINTEGAMESFGDVGTMKQQQLELRAHLRAGLGSLPAPKNDFEIVLPEGDALMDSDATESSHMVEDASEIEERNAQIRKAEGTQLHVTYIIVQLYIHSKSNVDFARNLAY